MFGRPVLDPATQRALRRCLATVTDLAGTAKLALLARLSAGGGQGQGGVLEGLSKLAAAFSGNAAQSAAEDDDAEEGHD